MKTYDEAVLQVAREYSHQVHDAMFPTFPYEKAVMIGFIFEIDPEKVVKRIKTLEVKNRKEWW